MGKKRLKPMPDYSVAAKQPFCEVFAAEFTLAPSEQRSRKRIFRVCHLETKTQPSFCPCR